MILGLVSYNICTVYTRLTKSQFDIAHLCVFVFNIPPTAKVIFRLDHSFMSHLTNSGEPGIKLVTPGLQVKWLIHYTTTAPWETSGSVVECSNRDRGVVVLEQDTFIVA